MIKNFFKNHNWNITFITLILQTISVGIIFSTTYSDGPDLVKKQLLLILFGYIVYFAISKLNHKWFKEKSVLGTIYIITLGLLIYVKYFTPAIAETNRWINFGFISLQPAEFAKITIILLTTAIISMNSKLAGVESITWHKRKNFKQKASTHISKQNLAIKLFLIFCFAQMWF